MYILFLMIILFFFIEMRLEEDSRILDLRSNKIAYLEAQLKNIIYGTTKGTL